MFTCDQFKLSNGLRVVVHPLPGHRIATLNLVYQVGSRNEFEAKTGLAHLLEHLMFGGSQHVPCYDHALQQVGGTNNAYTSTDVTSYYCTVPRDSLETAFWLESDRMLAPSFNLESLNTQRQVVCEEFKETCLNRPYGRAWHDVLNLAYIKHPYKWPTIGKSLQHIGDITLQDVRDFFNQFYAPHNAVLVVLGDVTPEDVAQLSQKWFGPISRSYRIQRALPREPVQASARVRVVEADVPADALFKAYHVPARGSAKFQDVLLVAALLGEGKSSRLYQQLVEKSQLFNKIEIYTTGSLDPGLLLIEGKLNEGVDLEQGEALLQKLIDVLCSQGISSLELEKIQNQVEASHMFESMDMVERAHMLALGTLLGSPDWMCQELEAIRSKTTASVQKAAQELLTTSNCSTLYIKKVRQ